jgi:hypothetical protein
LTAFGFYNSESWHKTGADLAAVLDGFAAIAGRPAQMFNFYYDWGPDFGYGADGSFGFAAEEIMDVARAKGAIPMMSWAPAAPYVGPIQPAYNYAAIIAGNHDAFLAQFAQDAQAWGHPFILRFCWEFEHTGFGQPWNFNTNGNGTAAQFITMWRHVFDVFAAAGNTNAKFLWCPVDTGVVATNYPGDQYVHFVGWDAYTSALPDYGNGMYFETVQENWMGAYRRSLGFAPFKPIVVGEYGADLSAGPEAKERWIAEGHRRVLANMPRMAGMCYFDQNSTAEGGWRVNTSSRMVDAYRDAVSHPLFDGACGPIPAPDIEAPDTFLDESGYQIVPDSYLDGSGYLVVPDEWLDGSGQLVYP